MKQTYNADSIQVLKFPESVRKRPGMYIGGSGVDGMHHLLWEVFDNAVDEAVAGHCDCVIITNEGNGEISVLDNGRGIPAEKNKQSGRSALELVFCELHAGGKFQNEQEGAGYSTSGGLHGVGASVSNACSSYLEAFVKRDGKTYHQRYERGVKKNEVEIVEETPVSWSSKTGTFVRFRPDTDIFKHVKPEWSYERVVRRARETAFLVPGLTIEIRGWKQENEEDVVFRFDHGLKDFLDYHLQEKTRLVEDFELRAKLPDLGCSAEAVFTYETQYDEHFVTFANNICTHEGGVHREAFLSALMKVITELGEQEHLLRGFGGKVKKSDVLEGLYAVVSVRLTQPEFEGQTKTKLGNPEVRRPLEESFIEQLQRTFKRRKQDAVKLATKIIDAIKARDAARKAKELTRKRGGFEHFTLQGKLAPCQSKNPEECELILVEGDSAGGSAKQGRNKRFQAILPFRGIVINAEKHLINKIMENKEIQALITALGVTPSRGGNVTDVEDLRFHKIIVCSDADPDGAHITCLLITFFYKFMRTLIEQGYVYVAEPPLFRVRRGKESVYLRDDEEIDLYREKHKNEKFEVTRFKGLGEMNPKQLAETVLDPVNRNVMKVTMEDAAEAARTVDALMGANIVGRKQFLFKDLALSDTVL